MSDVDQRAVPESGAERRAEKAGRTLIRGAVAIAAAALALIDARWGSGWEQPRIEAVQIARPQLLDLESAGALRQQFNDDSGNTRLVLLLSPT